MHKAKQTLLDIEALYLDYLNNFLTIEKFARHHDISIADAILIITIGRTLNNTKK